METQLLLKLVADFVVIHVILVFQECRMQELQGSIDISNEGLVRTGQHPCRQLRVMCESEGEA
jgi:hypothetical protein